MTPLFCAARIACVALLCPAYSKVRFIRSITGGMARNATLATVFRLEDSRRAAG